jgi:hypothetical protein
LSDGFQHAAPKTLRQAQILGFLGVVYLAINGLFHALAPVVAADRVRMFAAGVAGLTVNHLLGSFFVAKPL